MREIEIMTLDEYYLRAEAHGLRQLDKLYLAYQGVWAQRSINAVGEDGYYTIKELNEFFDLEEAEAQILGVPTAKSISKVSELEKRSERVRRAQEIARRKLEERRKLNGTK